MPATPMPRKSNNALIENLILLPWWVSILLGGITFVAIRYGVPLIPLQNEVVHNVFTSIAPAASWIALLCVVPAFLSLFHSFSKKRRLDATRSLEDIKALDWQKFEWLLAEAYRREGYDVEENLGSGADGGIDLHLRRRGEHVLVQCKQRANSNIGVSIVREMYGLLHHHRATSVHIVTTCNFTPDAVDFAKGKAIELYDGSRLSAFIASVQTDSVTIATPKPAGPDPVCEKCGTTMVVKMAKKGPKAGSEFWACPNFPECKFTKDISPSGATSGDQRGEQSRRRLGTKV